MISEVEVPVDHVALQQIAVVVLRAGAPVGVPEALVPLSHFTSEGQVELSLHVERDVLHVVQKIPPALGIPQITVVFLVAEDLVRRGRFPGLLSGILSFHRFGHRAGQSDTGGQCA